MKRIQFLLFCVAAVIFASCENEAEERIPDVNYNPVIDPDHFTDHVDNTYFPLVPGTECTFQGTTAEGEETIVVTVLHETKTILGVTCTIVRDVVSLEGQVIEDTYDWYAQDIEGNVWYFGEDVSNYVNGVLEDKEGSFEAGIDGALPGIVMMAHPVLELPYRQEYYFNHAEDWGKLVATGLTVTTPYGTFTDCIKTDDWNALEPDAPREYKYYAPGIGLVREEKENSNEVTELIDIAIEQIH
jgi:hypothetical protein